MSEYQEATQLEDLQFMKVIDDALNALIDKGKLQDSLQYIQEGIQIRTKLYNQNSQEVREYAFLFISKLCKLTIQQYEEEQPLQAIAIFKIIEQLISDKFAQDTKRFSAILIDLFNHVACCYRKVGQFQKAQSYLNKALDNCREPVDLAQTYVNICSIQSQQNQHQKALESGFQAMHIVQEQMMQKNLERHANIQKSKDQKDSKQNEKLVSILAVAFHNIGVEYEHLKKYEQCLKYYRKAVDIIETNAPNLPVAVNLRNALESAEKTLKAKIQNQKVIKIQAQPKNTQTLVDHEKIQQLMLKRPSKSNEKSDNAFQSQKELVNKQTIKLKSSQQFKDSQDSNFQQS